MIDLIKKLIKVSPRFGKNEIKAAEIIKSELKLLNIAFVEQPFETFIPNIINAELWVDGKPIDCLGSSLASGEIKSGDYLINAFEYSSKNKLPYNISYSPITDEISVVDFCEEPSITVSRESIDMIKNSNNVIGKVEVKKEKIKTENILVGNIINPKNIVIAHFDSIIGNGALDNAAGVAVLIDFLGKNKSALSDTLVIFSGNEEISYDNFYHRSGYGFRIFESKHGDLLEKADQIIVIDGVGIGEPRFSQEGLDWVLQVKMLEKIKNKVFWLQNDQAEVQKYFHTKSDNLINIKKKFLVAAVDKLTSMIID